MIYISHLDMQRMFQRAFRRANIALEFSQGFNPHPKMTYSPPLPLFTASDEEYFDVAVADILDSGALQKALPDGIVVNSARALGPDDAPLSEMISTAQYEIDIACADADVCCSALAAAYGDSTVLTIEKRDKKKRLVQKDIRPLVKNAAFGIRDGQIEILCELSLKNDTVLNPHLFISALFTKAGLDEKACDISVKKVKTLSESL
jgi:radical SAM-linked protein